MSLNNPESFASITNLLHIYRALCFRDDIHRGELKSVKV